MSSSQLRFIGKRNSTTRSVDTVEDVQDWENHLILRVPANVADRVHATLSDSPSSSRSDEMAIQMTSPDLRHASVRLGQHLMSARVYDLPCINEVMKTVDKRNLFKVADLSQIMICSHDLSKETTAPPTASHSTESVSGDPAKSAANNKKEQKQWQFAHGLTPPMKSVRRRRFRKTKKKKYMDAPEVEKELKRLLRADLEADSVRWEIVSAEDKKKEVGGASETTELFGDKVSSSEDEDAEPQQVKAEEDD